MTTRISNTSEPRGSQYTQSGVSPPATMTNTRAADLARAELKAAILLYEAAIELRGAGSGGSATAGREAVACHHRARRAIAGEYGERVARLIPMTPHHDRNDADVARWALRIIDEQCGLSWRYDVRLLALRYVAEFGTPAFVALLAKFGVISAAYLSAEDLPAFKAEMEAELANVNRSEVSA